jgi:hypothetical protein
LPDLSLTLEELETALDCLVSRLNVAVAAIHKLAVPTTPSKPSASSSRRRCADNHWDPRLDVGAHA